MAGLNPDKTLRLEAFLKQSFPDDSPQSRTRTANIILRAMVLSESHDPAVEEVVGCGRASIRKAFAAARSPKKFEILDHALTERFKTAWHLARDL